MTAVTLWCYVYEESPSEQHLFKVKSDTSIDVTDLKKLIKAKKAPALDHLPADALTLFKVSIPTEDRALFNQAVRAFMSPDNSRSRIKLAPKQKLSSYFDGMPREDDLIIVLLPGQRSVTHAQADPTQETQPHVVFVQPLDRPITPSNRTDPAGFPQGTPRLPLANPQGPATPSDAMNDLDISDTFRDSYAQMEWETSDVVYEQPATPRSFRASTTSRGIPEIQEQLPKRMTSAKWHATVDTELDKYKAIMERYARGDFSLPNWSQPSHSASSNLHIPDLGTGPELLLHDLGNWIGKDRDIKTRVSNIFDAKELVLFVNTSGSGKTRLLFEGLCVHWGLYFSCQKHSPASLDLQSVLDRLENRNELTRNLPIPLHSEDALQENRAIARHYFHCVLGARLAIFDLYLKIAGKDTRDDHKRLWLLLQVAPVELGFSRDIFRDLTLTFRAGKDQDVEDMIAVKLKSVEDQLPGQRIAIVIDEAQRAANMLTSAFMSNDRSSHRPVLRELLMTWTELFSHSHFIISGTGLSIDAVQDPVSSAAAKKSKHILIKDTGSFDVSKEQESYMMRYLWPDVKFVSDLTAEHQLLIQRAWRWLRGRYRFTASFVELLLLYGLAEANQRLNEYVFKISGHFAPSDYVPSDYALSDYPGPTPKVEEINYEQLLSNNSATKLMKDDRAMKLACYALLEYIIKGQLGPMTPEAGQLVELGIARFTPDGTTLDEPLALCATAKLFEGSNVRNLNQYIYDCYQLARTSSARGPVFEEVTALEIRHKFSRDQDTRLQDVFNFVGTPPVWAAQRAILVAGLGNEFVDASRISASSPCIGYQAPNPEGVISWLESAKGVPFLFPDPHMGPDLMFVLALEDGQYTLVAAQTKNINSTSSKRDNLIKAISTVSPGRFYRDKNDKPFSSSSRPGLLPRLMQSLSRFSKAGQHEGQDKYHLLRVITTYPSEVKLSQEIKNKIETETDPLATFRQEVIQQSAPFGEILQATGQRLAVGDKISKLSKEQINLG